MVDAAEVRQPKSANLFIVSRITIDDRQFRWWFSSLVAGPDDVWCLDVGVRQVKDRGELFNVQDVPTIDEETSAVFFELLAFKATTA